MAEHFGNSWRLVVPVAEYYAACEDQQMTILPVHPLIYYNTWRLNITFPGKEPDAYWNDVYIEMMCIKAGEFYV